MLNDVRFRLKWNIHRARERLYVGGGLLAARLLPRWVRYWVTLDSIARATSGKYGNTVVPELRAMDVLERI